MYESDKATTDAASTKLTKRMKQGSRQDKQLAALFKDNTINPNLPHFNNKKEGSEYLLDKSLEHFPDFATEGEKGSHSAIWPFWRKCVAYTT